MNLPLDLTDVRLMTKRLTLRPFSEDDVDDFYAYASVEGVGEKAGWKHHESRDESLQIIRSFIEDGVTFAMVYQGKVVGSIGVNRYDELAFPELMYQYGREIGYVLSKELWGNALVVEGVQAVLKYLFEVQDLDFVMVGHFPENDQSRRVIEKLGFTPYKEYTHTFPIGEKKCKQYKMTKEEWESLYSPK